MNTVVKQDSVGSKLTWFVSLCFAGFLASSPSFGIGFRPSLCLLKPEQTTKEKQTI